ncbi:uncharacterized protein [Malus domestica]|uniref:uncharacterized protein n=1 Tax=Malus domestica TaxID=3750 RepID=UPI003974B0E8
MSNLNKIDFIALEVSERNYLKWVQDVKLHLTAKGIKAIIEAPTDDELVYEDQKTEYLAEDDPRTLSLSLANHFDNQKVIYLPEAKHDWQHLRFQDFKSVNEYNSEVCRIRSLLKVYKVDLIESDLLEKTYSTFHATNIVMQQQYRAHKFIKFLDLISILLLTENITSF